MISEYTCSSFWTSVALLFVLKKNPSQKIFYSLSLWYTLLGCAQINREQPRKDEIILIVWIPQEKQGRRAGWTGLKAVIKALTLMGWSQSSSIDKDTVGNQEFSPRMIRVSQGHWFCKQSQTAKCAGNGKAGWAPASRSHRRATPEVRGREATHRNWNQRRLKGTRRMLDRWLQYQWDKRWVSSLSNTTPAAAKIRGMEGWQVQPYLQPQTWELSLCYMERQEKTTAAETAPGGRMQVQESWLLLRLKYMKSVQE